MTHRPLPPIDRLRSLLRYDADSGEVYGEYAKLNEVG